MNRCLYLQLEMMVMMLADTTVSPTCRSVRETIKIVSFKYTVVTTVTVVTMVTVVTVV